MRFFGLVLLVAAMILGTIFGGWYALPIASALWAALTRTRGAHWQAGLAALVAWGALLASMALRPAFATLLSHLGQLFPIPGAAVALVALVLAVVLSVSSARVVLGVVGVKTHTT